MPDDNALLFLFTEGLNPDMKIQVLLDHPIILVEAKKIVEYADMVIFSARQLSGLLSKLSFNKNSGSSVIHVVQLQWN